MDTYHSMTDCSYGCTHINAHTHSNSSEQNSAGLAARRHALWMSIFAEVSLLAAVSVTR